MFTSLFTISQAIVFSNFAVYVSYSIAGRQHEDDDDDDDDGEKRLCKQKNNYY